MLERIGLTVVLLLALTALAKAQDADIAAGKTYAKEVCAKCHAVLAGEDTSTDIRATPFQTIAESPGMTEMALTVFLQTPHINMPNLILSQDEMRNVVAYIRSLDSRN